MLAFLATQFAFLATLKFPAFWQLQSIVWLVLIPVWLVPILSWLVRVHAGLYFVRAGIPGELGTGNNVILFLKKYLAYSWLVSSPG